MALAINNVGVLKEPASGYGFVAPIGTTLPTDPTQDLASPFVSFGRIGSDGITRSFDTDTDGVEDMFGNQIATLKTSDSETFNWSMVDINEQSLKIFYGDGAVTVGNNDSITILSNGSWSQARVYALRFILNETATTITYGLIVIPNGTVSERGDQDLTGTDAIGHEVTINADADGNGNRAYLYISAPVTK